MIPSELEVVGTLESDAPVVTDLVRLPGRRAGVRRRLHPDFASDPLARQALVGEMETASRLPRDSKFFARLLAADDSNTPCLIRQYGGLGTLADRIHGPPLAGQQLVLVAGAVISGLRELWRLGAAHGDPSPANVIVTRTGVPLLADACSSRRVFAGGGPGQVDRESDTRRFLDWFFPLIRRAALDPEDALAADLLHSLRVDVPAKQQLKSLWLTVRGRGREAQPLGPAPPQPTSADQPAATPTPVAVRLAVGPLSDQRAAYLAARVVAPLAGVAPSALRSAVAEGEVAVDTEFPHPALELLGELDAADTRARVTLADTSQHPDPPDDPPPPGGGPSGLLGRILGRRSAVVAAAFHALPSHWVVACGRRLDALLGEHPPDESLTLAHSAERALIVLWLQLTAAHAGSLCLILWALKLVGVRS